MTKSPLNYTGVGERTKTNHKSRNGPNFIFKKRKKEKKKTNTKLKHGYKEH